MARRTWVGWVGAAALALGFGACGGSSSGVNPSETDGGTVGPPVVNDGGSGDAGPGDAGTDGGFTRRDIVPFGSPGPWGDGNVRYGKADGILEAPVVGVSTDETQNLWVATNQALYLLKPGETKFRRYDAADGLHLQSNPEMYCDDRFGTPDAGPRCPIYGGAADPGITEITGGSADEVFVGYAGVNEGSGDYDDPNRHSGKLDRVRLRPDGSLEVVRIDVVANAHGLKYWHNRTVMKLLYDHVHHPHDLYVGFNHGITLIRPDKYRPVNKGEWLDTVFMEYMADHLHPRVCGGGPCTTNEGESERNQRMGDWRGLAQSADGNLWVAGKWTAGKIRWVEDLKTWFSRGGGAFMHAFGDPYTYDPTNPGFINEPVFKVPLEGDPVHLTAVTVAPDGRVWFASGPTNAIYPSYGIAYWDGTKFTVLDPINDMGLEERAVKDLVALPDGRLLIASPTTGLTLYDPATGAKQSLRAPTYLPDNKVKRIEVDTRVAPFTVYVATDSGATRLRALP
jgi:hypothetical protein